MPAECRVQGGTLKWQKPVVLDPLNQYANILFYAPNITAYQTNDPHNPSGFVQSGTVFTGSAGPPSNLPVGALGTGGVVQGFQADTGVSVMNLMYTGPYCSDIAGMAIKGTRQPPRTPSPSLVPWTAFV